MTNNEIHPEFCLLGPFVRIVPLMVTHVGHFLTLLFSSSFIIIICTPEAPYIGEYENDYTECFICFLSIFINELLTTTTLFFVVCVAVVGCVIVPKMHISCK